MIEQFDVVVVGSGHAGAQVAGGLRQSKFTGSVALLSDEVDPPYERPPLSKEYLAGKKAFDHLLLRPRTFWSERDIVLRCGCTVVSVDSDQHRIVLASGEMIAYGALVWAAGGRPRRLSVKGNNLNGVHAIRNRADVDRLRQELRSADDVSIIGGGYIGLEAAAVLSSLGKAVRVFESCDRVLSRVAGEVLSRFYENAHRRHGVDIRLNASIAAIERKAGEAFEIRLSDGDPIRTDLIVVGIGIIPSVEPLMAAGAECPDGVIVDGQCRTSLPDIYAVGDCALCPNPFAGGSLVRLESVQNAVDQANVVVANLLGDPRIYRSVPWFWSNQYDIRLQTVGLSKGYDTEVVRGSVEAGTFSVVYLREGHVIALDCINATKDYVQGKILVESRARIDPAALRDAATPLKELAP